MARWLLSTNHANIGAHDETAFLLDGRRPNGRLDHAQSCSFVEEIPALPPDWSSSVGEAGVILKPCRSGGHGRASNHPNLPEGEAQRMWGGVVRR